MKYNLMKMLNALITWPKFSVTSYKMVHDMKKQGICPKTVIDVGANVGQFAVAASRIFKSKYIYSFDKDVRDFTSVDIVNCVTIADLGPRCDENTAVLLDYNHDLFYFHGLN